MADEDGWVGADPDLDEIDVEHYPLAALVVDDRSFVQLLCALRILLPDVGLMLSTREPPAARPSRDPGRRRGHPRVEEALRRGVGAESADAEAAEVTAKDLG